MVWKSFQLRTEVLRDLYILLHRALVAPTSRFAYKSIRLHRGRFAYTTEVVSPTRSESIRLHWSRFAYTKYLLLNTKYLSKNWQISLQ